MGDDGVVRMPDVIGPPSVVRPVASADEAPDWFVMRCVGCGQLFAVNPAHVAQARVAVVVGGHGFECAWREPPRNPAVPERGLVMPRAGISWSAIALLAVVTVTLVLWSTYG